MCWFLYRVDYLFIFSGVYENKIFHTVVEPIEHKKTSYRHTGKQTYKQNHFINHHQIKIHSARLQPNTHSQSIWVPKKLKMDRFGSVRLSIKQKKVNEWKKHLITKMKSIYNNKIDKLIPFSRHDAMRCSTKMSQ